MYDMYGGTYYGLDSNGKKSIIDKILAYTIFFIFLFFIGTAVYTVGCDIYNHFTTKDKQCNQLKRNTEN